MPDIKGIFTVIPEGSNQEHLFKINVSIKSISLWNYVSPRKKYYTLSLPFSTLTVLLQPIVFTAHDNNLLLHEMN